MSELHEIYQAFIDNTYLVKKALIDYLRLPRTNHIIKKSLLLSLLEGELNFEKEYIKICLKSMINRRDIYYYPKKGQPSKKITQEIIYNPSKKTYSLNN